MIQYTHRGRHFCVITLDRYCVKLGTMNGGTKAAFLLWVVYFFCPSHSVSRLWITAANGKQGTWTSSHTATVLLHLVPDLVSHHRSVLLELVQLHALLLHLLLVMPELFLQFCERGESDRKLTCVRATAEDQNVDSVSTGNISQESMIGVGMARYWPINTDDLFTTSCYLVFMTVSCYFAIAGTI